MTTRDVLFAILGIISAASAILAVTSRQVVHAALWLVVGLVGLSGCYLVLGQELVALVQLLVYVGAVVVLVLFALMLTRAPVGRGSAANTRGMQRAGGLVVAAGTAALLAATLIGAFPHGQVSIRNTDTTPLARNIFSTWVWPFEALSLLLLVALVTALTLTRLHFRSAADATEQEAGS